MSTIRAKAILRQLIRDLIGKDSYRGVTLTYSWLANQVGHLALGFIPTVILYFYMLRSTTIENPIVIAPLVVSGFWLLFELYNVLGPLLLKRKSASAFLYAPSKKYVFPPSWRNLAYDTFTDLCFFWLGACLATLPIEYNRTAILIAVLIIVILILPVTYWYVSKMHQQAAGYPFQFRLAQFDKEIPTHKQNVFLFLKPSNPPKHLLIFGSKKSGSTSLAVGIATEKSISHQRCTYTTAMKLFSMFSESEDNSHAKDSNLWTWRNCSLLVVDDINPGSPVNDVISPATFLHMLDAQREVNRNALRNKSVIWVMGNQDSSSKGWCALLEILGIQPRDVLVVHIS